MKNKILIIVLVTIALFIWGKNIVSLINKRDISTKNNVNIKNDSSLNYSFKENKIDFKYINPFSYFLPEIKKIDKKQTKIVVKKPQLTIIGLSDRAAVIKTSDGGIYVMRKPEKIYDYTISSISKFGITISDNKGNKFEYFLKNSKKDID